MKKIIYIITILYSCFGYSQNSREFLDELGKLRSAEQTEQQSLEGMSENQRQANLASIRGKYQNLESKLRTKYLAIEQRKKEIETTGVNQNSSNSYNGNLMLQQMQRQQHNTQNRYRQNISSTLNSLSGSLQALAYQNIEKELKRREKVAINFSSKNSSKIKKVKNLYNQIPTENFNKVINGKYMGHLFLEKEYSFINKQKLITEVPCLIVVENNKIVDIYPYGKKGFKLDYPTEMPSSSSLSNGIVKYNDFNTLETITVVLIEPYLSDSPKEYRINEKDTGYLQLYTSKKKDEGKIVWVQEIDRNGNIFREVSIALVYAKNEKMLVDVKKIPFNIGNKLYYFGEPTQTPYGTFSLFMKVSKSNMKPLKDGEIRAVKIKKYRQ